MYGVGCTMPGAIYWLLKLKYKREGTNYLEFITVP